MKTKRNYKDSVFRHLFNNEEKLLELFNALMGTAYPEGTSVKIITLENPIFVNVRNDLSAVVAEHYLFMAEHQSTVCLNIPLRMHIYIGEHFKELYKKKNLFAEGAEAVPKVRLFVLYNGRKEQPLEKTYKLSSAYSEKDDIIDLEICVHVININWEMGSQVLQKSETLGDYSRFIYMIRTKLDAGMERNTAISQTVRECIETGILADFLRKNGGEIVSWINGEISVEEYVEVRSEEAYRHGSKEGRREGRREGEVQSKNSIALKMLMSGFDIKLISEMTGLPEENIRNLNAESK